MFGLQIGHCAANAAKDADRPIRVAGSLPPLSSSYRSDLVQSNDGEHEEEQHPHTDRQRNCGEHELEQYRYSN